MTSSTVVSGLLHPVQRLVGAVGSAVDGAGDPLLVGLSDGELDQALVGLEVLISRLRVRQLGLVGEARSRNRAGAGGAVSHARWLGLLLGLDVGDAAGRVGAAAVLGAAAADPVAGPLVADARDGRCLLPQALIAARAVAGLPAELPPGGREAAGLVMGQAARELDPARLGRVAQRLVEVADPDGADARLGVLLERQDRDAHAARCFHLGRPVNGMVKGRFVLPTPEAEAVRAAIDALAGPRPGPHPEPPDQPERSGQLAWWQRGDVPGAGGQARTQAGPAGEATADLDQTRSPTETATEPYSTAESDQATADRPGTGESEQPDDYPGLDQRVGRPARPRDRQGPRGRGA